MSKIIKLPHIPQNTKNHINQIGKILMKSQKFHYINPFEKHRDKYKKLNSLNNFQIYFAICDK